MVLYSYTDEKGNQVAIDIDTKVSNVVITPVPCPPPPPVVPCQPASYDNFGSNWSTERDDFVSPNHRWDVDYLSNGFAKVENGVLVMSPALDQLRAAKIDAVSFRATGIHGSIEARLDKQNPNNTQPWMTIWPFIGYVNKTTHIYASLKTNGWEIGKKDNDLDPKLELQQYIKTGTDARAVIGQFNKLEWWIAPDTASPALKIRLDINGAKVFEGLDNAVYKFKPKNDGLDAERKKYDLTGWQRGGLTGQSTSKFFRDSLKFVAPYSEGSQVSWKNPRFEPFWWDAA